MEVTHEQTQTIVAPYLPPAARCGFLKFRLHGLHGDWSRSTGRTTGRPPLSDFCDVALLITLVAIWIESPLGASMCAVGIIGSQTLWVIGFRAQHFRRQAHRAHRLHVHERPFAFLRGLSLFHGWLPFLLVYLVWRLGYDGLRPAGLTGVAEALILISFFFMPARRPRSRPRAGGHRLRLGFSDTEPQQLMPGRCVGRQPDDPPAAAALRAGAFFAPPHHAEAGERVVRAWTCPAARLMARGQRCGWRAARAARRRARLRRVRGPYRARRLRHRGRRGLVGAALVDGGRREGRAILGGAMSVQPDPA